MKLKKNLLIIIPARGSSKRVKNKNLKKMGEKKLIEHKIKNCINSKAGTVLVSTDNKKIAKISKKSGAWVPFLRPKKYSSSQASMMSCVVHTLNFLKFKNFKLPDYVAILPPTYPFTKPISIKKAFNILKKNKKINSICSYYKSFNHPFEYVDIKKNKINFDIIRYKKKVLSNFERTQDFPHAFTLSGSIRITKTKYLEKFINNKSPLNFNYVIDNNSCIGFALSKKESFDINTTDDYEIAKFLHTNSKVFK